MMKALFVLLLLVSNFPLNAHASQIWTFSNGCKVECLNGIWQSVHFPAQYPIRCSQGTTSIFICPPGVNVPHGGAAQPEGTLLEADGSIRR